MWKPTREAMCTLIRECCTGYYRFDGMPAEIQKRMVASIEVGIHNATVDKARELNVQMYWDHDGYIELYSSVGYHITRNLDPKSSINKDQPDVTKYYLISGICNFVAIAHLSRKSPEFAGIADRVAGFLIQINPRSIGYFSSRELNPYINQALLDELEVRASQGIAQKFSTMYKCGKCDQRKTRSYDLQTRSGDEGYTTFINCLVCGHTWRQY